MDEKEYIASLLDDKMLFDEVLSSVGTQNDEVSEELSKEYKSGIKYETGIKNHKSKNSLF